MTKTIVKVLNGIVVAKINEQKPKMTSKTLVLSNKKVSVEIKLGKLSY